MSTNRRRFYYLLNKTPTTSEEAESMFFTESSSNKNINYAEINTNNNNNGNKDEKDNDELEFMPYTPTSVDRSSVGSIPWADDAIRQNQLDWERIEGLLANEEQALPEETELAQEIKEWQQKFPQMIGVAPSKRPKTFIVQNSYDSSSKTNLDDFLSNISMEFSDNENDDDLENELADSFATPTTAKHYRDSVEDFPHKYQSFSQTQNKRQSLDSVSDLAQLLSRNLRISSVPLAWRQRQSFSKDTRRQRNSLERSEISTSSPTPPPPPRPPPRRTSPTFNSLIIAPSQPKMPPVNRESSAIVQRRAQMPPLLNVLETKRRFRGLANNRSFVQLTQLHQTKSAALAQQNFSHAAKINQSAWHVPLAAATVGKRFFNQRNSVILPSINLRRINEHRSTEASSSSYISPRGVNSLQNYNMSVLEGRQAPAYYLQQQYVMPAERDFINSLSSTTPSTSGRSISAAVHHPRVELSAFYLPYSAANKFKSFNKI